ncbi:MAG: hypothetical protein ACK5JH_07905 [Anaerocolumna sp.]
MEILNLSPSLLSIEYLKQISLRFSIIVTYNRNNLHKDKNRPHKINNDM